MQDTNDPFNLLRQTLQKIAPLPQHVHITVTEPGKPEYWIDDVNFEGDPLITSRYRARLEGRGGPGIVALTRGAGGELVARRDIILEVKVRD